MADDSLPPSRPVAPPPHDRFFEDGEEPPARYDLEDELDYVVNEGSAPRPDEWMHTARRKYAGFAKHSFPILFGYVIVWLFSALHPFGAILMMPFEPILLAAITLRAIEHATGDKTPRRRRLFLREYLPLLLYNVLLCFVLLTAVALCWFFIYLCGENFGNTAKLVALLGSLMWIPVIFALHCRLFRFAPYFIVDQRLRLFAAMRGSWRVWRGNFWTYFAFEIVTLIVQTIGFLCVGVGIIFTKPFTTLFWIVAYLDAVRDADSGCSVAAPG